VSPVTPALVHRFAVTVDAGDLGAFTECAGLAVSYAVTDLREGGENGFAHRLWGPVSYGNVTLTRPLDGASAAVAAWVSSFATGGEQTGARIAALDPAGETIAAWSLRGVVPVAWTGPSWSAGGAAVAKETLVLAHAGFTMEGAGPSAVPSVTISVGFGS
jgi:phage tail-like protein